MRPAPLRSAAGLLLFTLLSAGCAKNVPRPRIEGKVLYKSNPVANKTLTLVFDAPQTDSFSHVFPLAADGTFKGEVSRPGNYKVVIAESMAVMEGREAKPAPGTEQPIPGKYRKAADSDIVWTIEPGANSKTIELKE